MRKIIVVENKDYRKEKTSCDNNGINIPDYFADVSKMIEQGGYRYQATPTVMLKGKWLSEFGFDIGTHVKVECEDGRLIITKEEEIEEIVQPVLCVAEGKAGYGKKKSVSRQRQGRW